MDIFISAFFILFLMVIFLVFFLWTKLQMISILKNNISHLNQTIEELDHQAKLIVKSDMELKLYQNEVDDKLNKLTLLKNLILSSVHILDREELFAQINEKIINDIGFRKGLILSLKNDQIKFNAGFNPAEIAAVKNFILHWKEALASNILLTEDSEICKDLASDLGSHYFLMSPLSARENIHAVFIVSDFIFSTDIRAGEKEIFSIICMYLGQCLDNVQLFEDMYQAKDELEKKIKERTNELVKSLREIEVISKTKSDFISSVSHELRTPLTSVKGFSSLLIAEKFGQLPPEAKKRLEKIDSNVNKLVDMVNILLDISRIESGKTEVKIAPGDIIKLINEVGDLLSPQMQAKNISFKIEAPGILNVYMDKNLIERVFINLINNSLKFTPQNGKIIVQCAIKENKALISVADTGCGIPKDDLEKVFQEFYRTRVTEGIQGTGLGLSLVKKIIDTHKEKIWVTSELEKGTTFYFTLRLGEN